MSWEDILKGKYVSKTAKRLIDEVMSDGEGRTARQIIDACLSLVDKINETAGNRRLGRYIPLPREVAMYLKLDPRYSIEKKSIKTLSGHNMTNVYKLK